MDKSAGRITRDVPDGTICIKCHFEKAILVARSEAVCGPCFINYIGAKLAKGMSGYRVSSKKLVRRLLLAHSFGPGSAALLNFINTHSQAQIDRTGRTGYEVLVVHVDSCSINHSEPPPAHLNILKARYPRFEYKSVNLEDIYRHDEAVREELNGIGHQGDLSEASEMEGHGKGRTEKLQNLIQSLPTKNSQMDIIELLRTRLIIETAKENQCDTILYAHTTTRLAEKILSELAKGRGRSIPWQVADGTTPYGVSIQHPLRDVHKKELDLYLELCQLDDLCLDSKAVKTPASLKNQSLDEIVGQYFKGVDENFPSVVANVVRTAGKLVSAKPDHDSVPCKVCGLPKDVNVDGWIKDEDQDDNFWSMKPIAPGASSEGRTDAYEMCYGCRRTVLGARNFAWPL